MAYFDSSKNRALWEIRLKELRAERAARAAGEGKSQAFREQKTAAASRTRVPMTYKELLAEEAKAVQSRRRGQASMERSRTREKEPEMGPKKGAGR